MKRTMTAAIVCGVLTVGMAPATPATASAALHSPAASSAAVLTAAAERKPAVVKGAAKPWRGAGFRVAKRAPGWQWVGARYLGKRIVYRIDPFKSANARKHRLPAVVQTVTGSPRSTARAAWVVSKYGRLKQAHQGAAVEIALHALLAPKKHALKDKATRKRLRSLGKARKTVRRYARVMLNDSATYAGPYQLVTDAGKPISDGGSTVVTATLLSATGTGVPGIPLTFTHPDGTTSTAETSATGAAAVTMTLTAGSDPTRAAVTASELPDVALRVMRPAGKKKVRKKAPRLVVAGDKTGIITQPVGIARKAKPTLTITTPPPSTIDVFDTHTFTATYAGANPAQGLPKAGRVELLGPFKTQDAAHCDPDAPARYGPFDPTFTNDATIDVGTVKFSVGGWYRLKGEVAGDDFNEPARSACGPPFEVAKAAAKLTLISEGTFTYDGSLWTETVVRYDGPVVTDGTANNPIVAGKLHGPFDSITASSCAGDRVFAPQTKAIQVTEAGQIIRIQMRIPTPGTYRTSATLQEGDFTKSAALCGNPYSTG